MGVWERGETPAMLRPGRLSQSLAVAARACKKFLLLLRLACLFDIECVQVSFICVKDSSVEIDECCCNNFVLQNPFPEKDTVQALKCYSLRHHTRLGSLMYQI